VAYVARCYGSSVAETGWRSAAACLFLQTAPQRSEIFSLQRQDLAAVARVVTAIAQRERLPRLGVKRASLGTMGAGNRYQDGNHERAECQ
jgi:hypothetical protein